MNGGDAARVKGGGPLAPSTTVRAASRAADREPRIVLRFALWPAAVLLVASAAILLFLRHEIADRTNQALARHTRFLAETVLHDSLIASDFAQPSAGVRRAELDRLFRTKVLVEGAVRVKLWSPTGRVTYSNDHSLIGTKAHEVREIVGALRGTTPFEIGALNEEGGSGRGIKTFSAYTRVRLADRVPPAGVFELYENYGPVSKAVRSAFEPVAAALALALLVLYGSLFPILRRVTGALETRNRRLLEQAHSLEMTVEAGQATAAALRRTSESFRALIEATPLGIVAVDRNGFVQRWNKAAERIFGWTEEEVLGQPSPIVTPKQRSEFRRIREQALAGKTVMGVEARRIRKDGTLIDVRLSTAPIYDPNGRIVSVIGLFEKDVRTARTDSSQ